MLQGLALRPLMLVILVFLTSASVLASPSSEPGSGANTTINVPEYDVLALDDNIRSILDQEIQNLPTKIQKLGKLHKLLYSAERHHIKYDSSSTKTALDTFYSKQGNCLSLANLFIATARHVGLEARYQFIQVRREWRPQNDFFEIPGHVNVVVELPGRQATIEFNSTYYEQSARQRLVRQVISDERAKADFYNNLGVVKLSSKNLKEAVAFFKKSISIDKNVDFSWSNLGVAYKHMGDFKKAEKSYQKALKINPQNNSVIRNIFILYKKQGNKEQADKYARKAEKYARKNPYYLDQLANQDIDAGLYKNAIKLAKSAIRIHNKEPDFFHTLATAHFYRNDKRASKLALEKAKALADSDAYKKRYQDKIDSLATAR